MYVQFLAVALFIGRTHSLSLQPQQARLLHPKRAHAEQRSVRSVHIDPTGEPNDDQTLEAAHVLQEDGVVVLLCPGLKNVAPTCGQAIDVLADVLVKAKLAGVNLENLFRLSEIIHRSYRRYDIPLSSTKDSKVCNLEFLSFVDSMVKPILGMVYDDTLCTTERSEPHCGKHDLQVIREGLITSIAGAQTQQFHADGPSPGLFNAFIPLVPVATQGTEFWLGSHDDPRFLKEKIPTNPNHISNPVMSRAQGIILFDYRIVHRGRAHDPVESPGPRPIFYRTYSLPGTSADDSHNYSADHSISSLKARSSNRNDEN
mmetsp:Transcript_25664/g.57558  ORF Transcript_25664/g.57558 Transcript_25664/m.57558 type:complete len:315 (-) Transcript_25664:110-1054(-)